ncbi:MAG: hypothetical protein GPJ54_00320 [Candidatus Heimdallarchaeota archaeon]|nr:hypothetical protein [Candidatus Heimdallarchaeota archaeon]
MSKRDVIPTSRSEWAQFKWQESQSLIAALLHSYNFMKFEELKLNAGSRADIVVIRRTDDEVVFGVIEVKTYSKINSSIEKLAFKQVSRYISNLFDIVNENQKWGKRRKRYFGSVVYTNDYPISVNFKSQESIEKVLPANITSKNDIHIFSSRPEVLIRKLQEKNLCGYTQNSLDGYFE